MVLGGQAGRVYVYLYFHSLSGHRLSFSSNTTVLFQISYGIVDSDFGIFILCVYRPRERATLYELKYMCITGQSDIRQH